MTIVSTQLVDDGFKVLNIYDVVFVVSIVPVPNANPALPH